MRENPVLSRGKALSSMVDSLTPSERSSRMARIQSANTKPEMLVRRLVHAMGYRYRLHGKGLPGSPDLVFSRRRKVIFVHGCFWHRHGEGCPLTRWPKSRMEFWRPKLEANQARDARDQAELTSLGWSFLVVWECEIRNREWLKVRIKEFLDDGKGA